jgi:hypothetical protein
MSEQQLIPVDTYRRPEGDTSTGSQEWRAARSKLAEGLELNTTEVAALFGVLEATVAKWAKTGRLRSQRSETEKTGAAFAWVFSPEDVSAALGWRIS